MGSLTAHHFSPQQEFSWLSAPGEKKNERLLLEFLFQCSIMLFLSSEGPKVKILPKLWLETEKHLANLANAHL